MAASSVREQVLALVRASFGAHEARVATTTGDAALEAFLHEPAQLALTAVHDAAATLGSTATLDAMVEGG